MQVPKAPPAWSGKERESFNIKALIKQFLKVLHPDKHSGTQSGTRDDERVAAFTQVTAYLNDVYAKFK